MIAVSTYELNDPLLDQEPKGTAANRCTGPIVMALLGFLLGLLLQFSSLAVFWMLQSKFHNHFAFNIFTLWSFLTTLFAMILTVIIGSLLSDGEKAWIETIEVIGVVASMFGASTGIVLSSIALGVKINFLCIAIILLLHSGVCMGLVKWSEKLANDDERKELSSDLV